MFLMDASDRGRVVLDLLLDARQNAIWAGASPLSLNAVSGTTTPIENGLLAAVGSLRRGR
jgi:hypothetical protein